jgi:hypothetical protein
MTSAFGGLQSAGDWDLKNLFVNIFMGIYLVKKASLQDSNDIVAF